MNTNYVLDTNLLYSVLDKEDSNHYEALAWLNDVGSKPFTFIIPMIVYIELICAKQEHDYKKFCNFLCKVLTKNTDTDIKFIESLPKHLRSTLKANDLLILAIAKRFNAKILTFDKKLLKLASKI